MADEVEEEFEGDIEIVRPVAHDQLLALAFNRLFACVVSPCPDRLATDENLLNTTLRLLRSHTTSRLAAVGGLPCVAKAIQRLDDAADEQISLAELAALAGVSRFTLLRTFAREVGVTPLLRWTAGSIRWRLCCNVPASWG